MAEATVGSMESLMDLMICIVQQSGVVATQWERDGKVDSEKMDELLGLMKMMWEKED